MIGPVQGGLVALAAHSAYGTYLRTELVWVPPARNQHQPLNGRELAQSMDLRLLVTWRIVIEQPSDLTCDLRLCCATVQTLCKSAKHRKAQRSFQEGVTVAANSSKKER